MATLPPKLQQTIEAQVQQAAKDRQQSQQQKALDEASHPNTVPSNGQTDVLNGGSSSAAAGSIQTEDKLLANILGGRIELVRHPDGQHLLSVHLPLMEWLALGLVLLIGVVAWWGWCYRHK